MKLVPNKTGSHLHVTVECPRLDASISPQFKSEVSDMLTDGVSELTLDLNSVQFVDSSALGTMVSILKMLEGRGAMTIEGVNPSVMSLFKLTRMDRVFTIKQAQSA